MIREDAVPWNQGLDLRSDVDFTKEVKKRGFLEARPIFPFPGDFSIGVGFVLAVGPSEVTVGNVHCRCDGTHICYETKKSQVILC